MKLKHRLISLLFSEDEKYILTQSLNLQKEEIGKEWRNGIGCNHFEDLDQLNELKEIVKNKLWK